MPTALESATRSDTDLLARASRLEEAAVREIIRLHNRRLFRIARSVLRNDADAEDVLQEAYVRAFRALPGFRGEASLVTWLSRIVLNEALQWLRRRRREGTVALPEQPPAEATILPFPTMVSPGPDPEQSIAQRQLVGLLEHAIDQLPDDFRLVLVARVIEDMSIEETAELLGLQPATVKTRLFRARRLLREALAQHVGPVISSAFPFAGRRCERMADAVLARLRGEH